MIVRGIKSGLPLGDCMRMIAGEAQEPLRGEFRAIIDAQTLGMSIADAVAKLFERVPVAEANFFGIVIAIQQKAGGNLSEALGNLSRVLRDRRKMAGKIKAMSMEAKASAAIIGCLPFIGRHPDLPVEPELHRAPVDDADRQDRARRLRHVDGDRRLRDEEDDHLRLLKLPCRSTS